MFYLSDKLMYALKNMNNWNRMPDALKEQVSAILTALPPRLTCLRVTVSLMIRRWTVIT